MAVTYGAARLNTWATSLATGLNGGSFQLRASSTLIVEVDLEATAYDVSGAVLTARGADGSNPIGSGNRLSGTSVAAGTIDNYRFLNSSDVVEFSVSDTTGLSLATLVSPAAGVLFEFTNVEHTLS